MVAFAETSERSPRLLQVHIERWSRFVQLFGFQRFLIVIAAVVLELEQFFAARLEVV